MSQYTRITRTSNVVSDPCRASTLSRLDTMDKTIKGILNTINSLNGVSTIKLTNGEGISITPSTPQDLTQNREWVISATNTGGGIGEESDPLFAASAAYNITFQDIESWNSLISYHAPTWGEITGKPTFSSVAFTNNYNDLTNKPFFATVATTGSYTDLINKPSIPSAQVQSDWNATSGLGVILNKPIIPAPINLIQGDNIVLSGTYPNITISSTASGTGTTVADGNNFPTVLAFDAPTRVLSLQRNGLSTLTATLPAYITSYTETDPIFLASPAHNITSADITRWNTQGSSLGFTPVQQGGGIVQGTNKVYIGYASAADGLKATVDLTDLGYFAFKNGNITDFVNNAGYITGAYTGFDTRYKALNYVPTWTEITGKPTIPAQINLLSGSNISITGTYPNITISSSSIADGNNYPTNLTYTSNVLKLSRNGLSDLSVTLPNYLTSYTETDPVFRSSAAFGIAPVNISQWNAAYSWGDHHNLYKPLSYVPTWTEVTGKPTFATVATSGDYNDLINKPADPSGLFASKGVSNNLNTFVASGLYSKTDGVAQDNTGVGYGAFINILFNSSTQLQIFGDAASTGQLFWRPNVIRPWERIWTSYTLRSNTENDSRYVALAGIYDNPTWVHTLDYSKLTNVPAVTIPTLQQVLTSGNVATKAATVDTITANHFIGMGGKPVTYSLGANVSSISVSGTDTSFKFTVVTSGAVSGTICYFNFARAFATPPIITFSNATFYTCLKAKGAINASTGAYGVFSGQLDEAGTYEFNFMAIQ